MILPSQWNRFFKCTATGSVTGNGISSLKFARFQCLRRDELLQRSTFWMDALTPENHAALPPATLTCALAAKVACTPSKTPPTCCQNPVPLGLIVAATMGAGSSFKDHCLVGLLQIGMYFCLRLCKNTKTNSHRRTMKFRLRDILFQDACGAIPFDAPTSRFLNELVVTLFLDTQKNSVCRESISMELTRLLLDCPVVACTHRFLHLRNNNTDLDTPICVYFDRKGAAGNPSPAITWWSTFGFGLATSVSLDWGSTHTKLALTPFS